MASKNGLRILGLIAAVFMLAIGASSVYAISIAEIAQHNTAANCWSAISGNVYDLTSFVAGHPGGPIVAAICGIDGTDLFLGQHGSGYLALVSNLQIGVLTTPDVTAPVITLLGVNPASVIQGGAYSDAGATAVDNVDGAVSVATSGSVNTAVVGAYAITYTAVDAAGNTATATRTVNVFLPASDTTPPVISIIGNSVVRITVGGAYTDAGATALDNVNGVVAVVRTGTVNTAVVGTYAITYTAVDAAGNTATAVRSVIVQAASPTPGDGGDDESEVEDESEIEDEAEVEDETEVHTPDEDGAGREDRDEGRHEFGEHHMEDGREHEHVSHEHMSELLGSEEDM